MHFNCFNNDSIRVATIVILISGYNLLLGLSISFLGKMLNSNNKFRVTNISIYFWFWFTFDCWIYYFTTLIKFNSDMFTLSFININVFIFFVYTKPSFELSSKSFPTIFNSIFYNLMSTFINYMILNIGGVNILNNSFLV